MNIDIKKILIAFGLGGCVLSAFANPNQREDRREFQREDRRSAPQPGYMPERNDRRFDQGEEDIRKKGRMSPEDRRALRRQIDEAGQDIYSNKYNKR